MFELYKRYRYIKKHIKGYKTKKAGDKIKIFKDNILVAEYPIFKLYIACYRDDYIRSKL